MGGVESVDPFVDGLEVSESTACPGGAQSDLAPCATDIVIGFNENMVSSPFYDRVTNGLDDTGFIQVCVKFSLLGEVVAPDGNGGTTTTIEAVTSSEYAFEWTIDLDGSFSAVEFKTQDDSDQHLNDVSGAVPVDAYVCDVATGDPIPSLENTEYAQQDPIPICVISRDVRFKIESIEDLSYSDAGGLSQVAFRAGDAFNKDLTTIACSQVGAQTGTLENGCVTETLLRDEFYTGEEKSITITGVANARLRDGPRLLAENDSGHRSLAATEPFVVEVGITSSGRALLTTWLAMVGGGFLAAALLF